MNRGHIPSTAAITTLSSAVSVALVKLQRPFKLCQYNVLLYALNVYLAFLCPSRLLCETHKAPLEVVLTCLDIPGSTVKVGEDTLDIRVLNFFSEQIQFVQEENLLHAIRSGQELRVGRVARTIDVDLNH
jgi:hypothetical protein